MYKLFESHVYSAHSVTKNQVARPPERRPGQQQQQSNNKMMMGGSGLQVTASRNMPMNMNINHHQQQNNSSYNKPLKINDEITIIPQPMANNSSLQRNKGSLTITPHSQQQHQPMRRSSK